MNRLDSTARPAATPNLGPTQTKYEASNPLLRLANRRFFETARRMLGRIPIDSLIDAGAGEGMVLAQLADRLQGARRIVALDIDTERAALAHAQSGQLAVVVGDVHRLPFASDSFDVVLMLEVLEHLGNPRAALREAHRTSKRYILCSVPHEPWWRIGNMLRLKYLNDWGNTPEHINHWTSRGFRALVAESFRILEVSHPFLWTFVLGTKSE